MLKAIQTIGTCLAIPTGCRGALPGYFPRIGRTLSGGLRISRRNVMSAPRLPHLVQRKRLWLLAGIRPGSIVTRRPQRRQVTSVVIEPGGVLGMPRSVLTAGLIQ
jgi:hypothetical protein